MLRAVFFDVDFTLIHPGPMFQGSGYRDFCARYAVTVDPDTFAGAVLKAAATLESHPGVYDPEVFVRYTSRIIEAMGGHGPGVEQASRDIYDEWATCHHFQLYEDVPPVLRTIRQRGFKIGLISNTQRCLATFEDHFELRGLFDVALSSSNHGYMKPHPSIFEAALTAVSCTPEEAVMVGDSLAHDIAGARSIGMRGVLVARAGCADPPSDVPVIQSLHELPPLL
jgi:putative hydrolase of the HAD superfamily